MTGLPDKNGGLDHIPEYFDKPGVLEGLSQAHPVLLIRQMANEIIRLKAAPSTVDAPAHLQDAPRTLKNVFKVADPNHPTKEVSVVYASFAVCLEREANALRSAIAPPNRDAEYYKWRLQEIMPLFEEARDALPAISMVALKLHNLSPTLGERMDAAGTRSRADFDALGAPTDGKGQS